MSADQKNLRPPVIVVLGHVDHGKTTLLDYLRKSNVAERESGGITQHIGAYQIVHGGKTMTFIDTPGHEAFSQMRRRGASVADLAILVVAADEGVKPQTLEAAEHIRKANLPFAVALNKSDRPGADPNRLKKELSEHDVLVEEWGGKVPALEVSAKTGKGVPELLDLLMLLWELEGKAAESGKAARGVVIESHLDAKRGPTTTFLVREGTLRPGSVVRCGAAVGKVRVLESFQGKPIEVAPSSTPALIVGLDEVPTLGDECVEEPDEGTAREEVALYRSRLAELARTREVALPQGLAPERILNIALKADVKGSEEAILESLGRSASSEVALRVVSSGVGDVAESDVKLADSMKAIVVAFRVKIPSAVASYAEHRRVRILSFTLIYELLSEVRKELTKLLPVEIVKKTLGTLKLLGVFRPEGDGIIVGGRMSEGRIRRGAECELIREGKIIGRGTVRELRIGREAVEEVREGTECGLLYAGKGGPAVGDIIAAFEQEERRKELV